MKLIGKVVAAVAVSVLVLPGVSTAGAQSSDLLSTFSSLSSGGSSGLVEQSDEERLEKVIERSYRRNGGVLFDPFEDGAAGYAEQAVAGDFEFHPVGDGPGTGPEGYVAFSVSPGHITMIYRNAEASIPEFIHRVGTEGMQAPFPGPTGHMGVEVRTGGGYVYVAVLSGLGEPPPVVEE